uniref:AMP-binding protein n=2 Tax=Helianthus annuus TaxID=4232 RepID=F1C964_HELAN|nr:AMP-binding protein [Helianthus annuus]
MTTVAVGAMAAPFRVSGSGFASRRLKGGVVVMTVVVVSDDGGGGGGGDGGGGTRESRDEEKGIICGDYPGTKVENLGTIQGKIQDALARASRDADDTLLVDEIGVLKSALGHRNGHIRGVGRVVKDVTHEISSSYPPPRQQQLEELQEEMQEMRQQQQEAQVQVTAKCVYSAIANLGVTHFCAALVVLNSIVNTPRNDTILPLPPPCPRHDRCGRPATSSPIQNVPNRVPCGPHIRALRNFRAINYLCMETQMGQPPSGNPSQTKHPPGCTLHRTRTPGCRRHLNHETGPTQRDHGYLKNPKANSEAFAHGWFHSGDLAVKHPWGESPCAFVTLKTEVDKSDEGIVAKDIMKFCLAHMPGYWVPKSIVFGLLPKTATGKVQKHLLRAKAKEMGPVKTSKL